nr:E3 ubiquitin-protein ligase listerin [Ipomoea batatas]
MSSSLLICDLCSALFADDPARFLLMLAVIPFVVCLVAIVFLREVPPTSTPTVGIAEAKYVWVINVVAVVIVIYLLAFDLTQRHGLVMMEEVAENVNDAISHTSSSRNLEMTLEMLEIASHVREKAVKSVEIWGLSKGPINSLLVLLFSPKPLPSLQFATYVILSTEPVSHLAFGTLRKESSSDEDASNNQDYRNPEPFAEKNIHLREEISSKLENFPTEVLEMDLLSSERVSCICLHLSSFTVYIVFILSKRECKNATRAITCSSALFALEYCGFANAIRT